MSLSSPPSLSDHRLVRLITVLSITRAFANTCRYLLGRVLGAHLAQVFLGFRRGNVARPRRAAVSLSTLDTLIRHLISLAARAPQRSALFVMIIIKAPIIQIISVALAGFIIALEFPIPFLKGTRLHRSIVLRIPLLLLQVFFAVLFYQVSLCRCVPTYGTPSSLIPTLPL